MPHRPTHVLAALFTTVGVTIFGGCATNGDDSIGHSLMKPESAPRVLNQALLAQAANGAAEDRMLFDAHFDGVSINSLGEQKLALMMEDPAWHAMPEVFVVTNVIGRAEAVRDFFAQLGLTASDVRVQVDPNPAAGKPAVVALARQAAMTATSAQRGGEGR